MLYSFEFKYAGLTIDAAIDDDGNQWIATPTIMEVLGYKYRNGVDRSINSQDFKFFAGDDFEIDKLKAKSTKYNTQNTYYSKDTFLKLVYFEVQKANPVVLDLVVSGFLVDFEGSIQNALGTQMTEEQREYLRALVHERIQAFRSWTDIIRDRYLEFYGKKPEGWYYGKLIKRANLALFGVPDFGNDHTANMTEQQQETIKDFERYLYRKARNNPELEPEAVLNLALDQFTN